MKRRRSAACAVALALTGLVGYLLSGFPLFVLVAFAGIVAILLALAGGNESDSWTPPDSRRANEHDEHQISPGPAPPGPS